MERIKAVVAEGTQVHEAVVRQLAQHVWMAGGWPAAVCFCFAPLEMDSHGTESSREEIFKLTDLALAGKRVVLASWTKAENALQTFSCPGTFFFLTLTQRNQTASLIQTYSDSSCVCDNICHNGWCDWKAAFRI